MVSGAAKRQVVVPGPPHAMVAETRGGEREPLTLEMPEFDKEKQTQMSPSNPKPPASASTFKTTQTAVAVLLLVGILGFPGDMELDGAPVPAAKRCLAILVCVSTLWATEAVPLYVTALLIPILTVASKALLPASAECAATDTLCKQARFTPLAAPQAAKEICGQFFDPTVLLFMAGFSIGAVLEKYRLSNMIASLLLKPFGNRPENVLLGIMSLGCFLSMWISNVPSSVLCVSLAQPIINQLPQRDPYAKVFMPAQNPALRRVCMLDLQSNAESGANGRRS